MQTLLNDIELDIQELKCLMQAISNDANPALRIVVKRNIQQMRMRLDELQVLLEESPVQATTPSIVPQLPPMPQLVVVQKEPDTQVCPVAQEEPVASVMEVAPIAASPAASILAERIKPATDLRKAISLNDSFRFTRELFNGDGTRMNEVVRRLGEASCLECAMDVFMTEVHPAEESEAVNDFVELLKKYFS